MAGPAVLATGGDGLLGNALLLEDEPLESMFLVGLLLSAALLVGRGLEALLEPVTLNGIGLNPLGLVNVGFVWIGLLACGAIGWGRFGLNPPNWEP